LPAGLLNVTLLVVTVVSERAAENVKLKFVFRETAVAPAAGVLLASVRGTALHVTVTFDTAALPTVPEPFVTTQFCTGALG
jgi:hypothetical protein